MTQSIYPDLCMDKRNNNERWRRQVLNQVWDNDAAYSPSNSRSRVISKYCSALQIPLLLHLTYTCIHYKSKPSKSPSCYYHLYVTGLPSMNHRLTQSNSHITSKMSPQSDIHLYTTQTPNGIKISITLEELGLSYEVHKIDISQNTQKEPWFLEINPNGRIPALTDTFTDGEKIRLFESGSIQQYLVDRYDADYKISYPKGTREYYEVNNWVIHFTYMSLNQRTNVGATVALFPQRRSRSNARPSQPLHQICS